MSRDRQTLENNTSHQETHVENGILVTEHGRGIASRASHEKPAKTHEGIPWFWSVFGGTLLSVTALVCINIYNQINNSLNDLRKELVQQQEARTDLIKKDEFNTRLATYWSGLKDVQTATNSISALNERWRLLDQQVEKQAKLAEQERKELNGKVEDLRKSHQLQGEDLRKLVEGERKDLNRQLEEIRKSLDQSGKDLTRKLEEQTKAAQEERKEWHRKLEDQLKSLTDERRELNLKVQMLGERLAALEGRQAVQPAEKKTPPEK